MSDELLRGLDGEPISTAALANALSALDGRQAVEVADVQADECSGAGGTSAVLSLTLAGEAHETRQLFLKKVTAAALVKKAWADRRRSLAYGRTEVRFYTEFAAALSARGCRLPRVGAIVSDFAALGEDSEVTTPAGDEPPPEALARCGALLLLEPAAKAEWWQGSPLSEAQARATLAALARLHAAAWEDRALLAAAATRLQVPPRVRNPHPPRRRAPRRRAGAPERAARPESRAAAESRRTSGAASRGLVRARDPLSAGARAAAAALAAIRRGVRAGRARALFAAGCRIARRPPCRRLRGSLTTPPTRASPCNKRYIQLVRGEGRDVSS
jgi:hypothetical protein